MYPVSQPEYKPKARPIGTFVIAIEDVPGNPEYRPRWYIEKVTAHTEHGAELRTRWCEAESDRKAYLITLALNSMPKVNGMW